MRALKVGMREEKARENHIRKTRKTSLLLLCTFDACTCNMHDVNDFVLQLLL